MIDSFKIVAESAQDHSAWAISILAGTVAAIVGTSHYSPKSLVLRSMYFLFIPAWISLGLAIYYGDRVFRSYLAAAVLPEIGEDRLIAISRSINSDYHAQQLAILAGVAFGMIWLTLYLLWWIIRRPADAKEN